MIKTIYTCDACGIEVRPLLWNSSRSVPPWTKIDLSIECGKTVRKCIDKFLKAKKDATQENL